MEAETAGELSDIEILARLALNEGQAALLAQDNEAALRWLDRAHRLVPADPNVMLALGSACLSDDAERAAALFRRVAEVHDVAQAWLGLAACRLRLGDAAGAQVPLAQVLATHALNAETIDLIGRIAVETGWCGLHSDGRLEVHLPTGSRGKPIIVLDGKPVTGRRLPSGWPLARLLDVRVGDTPLPGSPIRIELIRRLVGCVEAVDGGITGWAWHPNDPATDPVLTLRWPETGQERRIVAAEQGRHVPHSGPLARPRAFAVKRADLPTEGGPLHILGLDGRHLLGSPLDPLAEVNGHAAAARALARIYAADGTDAAELATSRSHPRHGPARPGHLVAQPQGMTSTDRARSDRDQSGTVPLLADALIPAEPVGADGRKRAVTVIVPVSDGGKVVRDCLRSLLATTTDARILVVDDGSRDPGLVAQLDELAKSRRVRLLRHAVAQGFPAAANAGMRAARGTDIVLLNSDTLLPPDWLVRLRAAAYAARDIGTVTPLSNNASILSYPAEAGRNPFPSQADVDRLDRVAQRANRDATVDVPVGVGFCLYIRRDCLNAVGALRSDLFAQGYGEENDFCLRARHLGWRNIALPGLFVGHLGGVSFGAAAAHLQARNGRILERLHPGYEAMVRDWVSRDPLAEARRRMDLLRWGRPRRGGSVILITHNDGGGVESRVEASARAHRDAGRRPIVLRPARTAGGEPAIAVHDGVGQEFPNLIYAIPTEIDALLALLRAARPSHAEVHHLIDYGAPIYEVLTRLAPPRDVFVHDYAWFCARVALVGRDHYCGEPDLRGCSACVADHGHFLSEEITPAALHQRSAAFLASARRVVVPTDDVGTRLQRHFPNLTTVTIPHEDDAMLPPMQPPLVSRDRVRVCVVGGIGLHKGYDIVLACARDAEARRLDLEFIIVGSTTDDVRLMATGRVFVTGRFKPEEAVGMIRQQNADLGFVASVCPETWSLTLSDIWRAGLPACAFDFGAPAERIRRTGRGFVLPMGLPPAAINNAMLSAARSARENMPSASVSCRTMRHVASGRAQDFAMHAEK